MKKAILCLLALALLLPAVGALAMEPPAHRYEGDGFATPEEAVTAYLDGLKAGDLEAMLATFAIECYVAGFDLAAMMEDWGFYDSASMEIRLPNETAFARSLNVETRKAGLAECILHQYLAFHLPELDLSRRQTFEPEHQRADMQALLARFATLQDPAISRMEFTGFFPLERFADLYSAERLQEFMARQRDTCGAEEIRSVVAGFTVDGTPYRFCCDVIRYGDAWRLLSLGGHFGIILGMPDDAGGIMPASP